MLVSLNVLKPATQPSRVSLKPQPGTGGASASKPVKPTGLPGDTLSVEILDLARARQLRALLDQPDYAGVGADARLAALDIFEARTMTRLGLAPETISPWLADTSLAQAQGLEAAKRELGRAVDGAIGSGQPGKLEGALEGAGFSRAEARTLAGKTYHQAFVTSQGKSHAAAGAVLSELAWKKLATLGFESTLFYQRGEALRKALTDGFAIDAYTSNIVKSTLAGAAGRYPVATLRAEIEQTLGPRLAAYGLGDAAREAVLDRVAHGNLRTLASDLAALEAPGGLERMSASQAGDIVGAVRRAVERDGRHLIQVVNTGEIVDPAVQRALRQSLAETGLTPSTQEAALAIVSTAPMREWDVALRSLQVRAGGKGPLLSMADANALANDARLSLAEAAFSGENVARFATLLGQSPDAVAELLLSRSSPRIVRSFVDAGVPSLAAEHIAARAAMFESLRDGVSRQRLGALVPKESLTTLRPWMLKMSDAAWTAQAAKDLAAEGPLRRLVKGPLAHVFAGMRQAADFVIGVGEFVLEKGLRLRL